MGKWFVDSQFYLFIYFKVERSGGNDASKMQSILQDLLKQHNITDKVLTPVYNPRLTLGKLNPAKCKIMTSKKVTAALTYITLTKLYTRDHNG